MGGYESKQARASKDTFRPVTSTSASTVRAASSSLVLLAVRLSSSRPCHDALAKHEFSHRE